MRCLILPAVGLLVIGLAAQASVAARSPSPDDQAAWFLLNAEEGPKLVYGLANSDQIGLMLTCVPGSAMIRVYGEWELDLSSLTPISSGPGPADPLSHGQAFEMSVSAHDPGFRHLSTQGYLPVRLDGERSRIQANLIERGLAERFITACTRRHA